MVWLMKLVWIYNHRQYKCKPWWVESGDWELFVSMPCKAILEVMLEMRKEGRKVPYMVFWSGANEHIGWGVVDYTYEEFYKDETYKDCWVYWEGKPLHLVTGIPGDLPAEFTIRKMGGLNPMPGVSEWSFEYYQCSIKDEDGYVEQMCVCVAAQNVHDRAHGSW